jgi:hypothetical protein
MNFPAIFRQLPVRPLRKTLNDSESCKRRRLFYLKR